MSAIICCAASISHKSGLKTKNIYCVTIVLFTLQMFCIKATNSFVFPQLCFTLQVFCVKATNSLVFPQLCFTLQVFCVKATNSLVFPQLFVAPQVSGAEASWHLLPRNSRSITLVSFGVVPISNISCPIYYILLALLDNPHLIL